MLYGPNSQLDPDNFIQTVLQTIGDHKDLSKEFRRFLPDDIEEDDISGNFGTTSCPLAEERIPIGLGDDLKLINKLKGVAQQRLIELLKEYGEVKQKKSPQEALRLYTDKIMEIAESYHQYLTQDTQKMMKLNNGVLDQNGMPYSVAQHEANMNLILELIPQEIVENYKLVVPDEHSPKKKRKGKKNEQSFVSSSKLESSEPADGIEGSQF